MRTIPTLAAGIIVAAVSSSAFAQGADQKFIKEAIEGNLAEVQMGQLAQQNGQSQGVKDFGQMLVTDHGQANTKAQSVAQSMNVTPPTQPNAKQKKEYDKMSKLNGAAFGSSDGRSTPESGGFSLVVSGVFSWPYAGTGPGCVV